ncbi:MAG: hypothetical protein DMF03_06890 [Verrucomicrobia bacterium]|nr:MAG: hypothetical protein DMF03_06890 [Verrucomicrobiota bacterium]
MINETVERNASTAPQRRRYIVTIINCEISPQARAKTKTNAIQSPSPSTITGPKFTSPWCNASHKMMGEPATSAINTKSSTTARRKPKKLFATSRNSRQGSLIAPRLRTTQSTKMKRPRQPIQSSTRTTAITITKTTALTKRISHSET